jgi:hypothetical protein
MAKNKPYVCPKCGHNDYTVTGYAFDADQTDEGEIIEFVYKTCRCLECNEEFEEYSRLVYDGYYHNGIIYDRNGAKYCP